MAAIMETWYSKDIGDGLTASEPCGQIENAFAAASAATGKPPGMAAFIRYDSEGHLQCHVTAFFSPAAASIARLVDAVPCTRPARERLMLLCGYERCGSAFFATPAGSAIRFSSSRDLASGSYPTVPPMARSTT